MLKPKIGCDFTGHKEINGECVMNWRLIGKDYSTYVIDWHLHNPPSPGAEHWDVSRIDESGKTFLSSVINFGILWIGSKPWEGLETGKFPPDKLEDALHYIINHYEKQLENHYAELLQELGA